MHLHTSCPRPSFALPINGLCKLPQKRQETCHLNRQQLHSSRSNAPTQQLLPGVVPPCTVARPVCAAASADPLAASIVAAPEPGFASSGILNDVQFTKQQLLDVAATFVKLWFAGIAKGPQAVEQELARILAPDVLIKADRVKLFKDTQGLSEVLAELERAHLEYHRSEHRPMLYAASPETQRAYALVEGRYQDVGALPGHPATFRISKVHHILSVQVVRGRIAVLWLRRQLTEEDKDELLHEPLACYPAPFPRESLELVDAAQHELTSGRMVDTLKAWWQAWGSGTIEQQPGSSTGGSRSSRSKRAAAVGQLLASDFKMWDAYGLYPSMRAQGRRYLSKDAALRYMQSLAYSYDIQLTVLDIALAEGSLACFSHWQAHLVPRWHEQAQHSVASLASLATADAGDIAAAAGVATPTQQEQQQQQNLATSSAQQTQVQQQQQQQQIDQRSQPEEDGSLLVDGLAVDLFNDALQVKVIWVFRGPVSEQEMQLFLEYDRQQAAAEAAQAASDQEAVRATRRAQREQQLHELLAWMNNYQQQWTSYMSHVQKQIARQQRLAKQQLIKQLQESQSPDQSLEEDVEGVPERQQPLSTTTTQQQQEQQQQQQQQQQSSSTNF